MQKAYILLTRLNVLANVLTSTRILFQQLGCERFYLISQNTPKPSQNMTKKFEYSLTHVFILILI